MHPIASKLNKQLIWSFVHSVLEQVLKCLVIFVKTGHYYKSLGIFFRARFDCWLLFPMCKIRQLSVTSHTLSLLVCNVITRSSEPQKLVWIGLDSIFSIRIDTRWRQAIVNRGLWRHQNSKTHFLGQFFLKFSTYDIN